MNNLNQSRSWLAAVSITLALIVAGNAQAAHRDKSDRYADRDYGKVINVKPIYRQVRVSHPRRECWEERVTHIEHPGRDHTGATILGGLIGGVIGHQFGGTRKDRDAAAVAGALLGMKMGNDHSRHNSPGPVRHSGWEESCRTVDEVVYEERLDGYDVTYRYAGRVYETRMPYDPGKRIPVRVSVIPVHDD